MLLRCCLIEMLKLVSWNNSRLRHGISKKTYATQYNALLSANLPTSKYFARHIQSEVLHVVEMKSKSVFVVLGFDDDDNGNYIGNTGFKCKHALLKHTVYMPRFMPH